MKEPFLEPILRRMRIGRVVDEVKSIQNCCLLDIGCGFNHRFLSFVEPYIEYGIGIDFKVHEVSYKKISTKKMTLDETLPFKECAFNAVTMLAVLEHIDKPRQIISEVYRVLKPEGKFILTVPGKLAKPVLEFLAFKVGVVNKNEIEDHKKYYDLYELEQLVSNIYGFEIVKHKHFQFGMNNFCVIKKTSTS
ncbi:class I SAM-dependent methyltransferase [Candidatus Electronema sp. PJ]|uniref:class I SAM-dependent methyltransferase n=1 Tax=Candidatus Electronema sp. PJ TaxID=3401572 RepID=UPI003AA815A5